MTSKDSVSITIENGVFTWKTVDTTTTPPKLIAYDAVYFKNSGVSVWVSERNKLIVQFANTGAPTSFSIISPDDNPSEYLTPIIEAIVRGLRGTVVKMDIPLEDKTK